MSPPDPFDASRARRWLAVAVGSLLLAGIFALLLVVGRMPPLSLLLTDPGFFRRCLVVHVDLALVVWFYAFLAALFALVPSRAGTHTAGRHAPLVATLGVCLMMAATAVRSAEPVLANYIPVLDHSLYLAGLAIIGLALAFHFLEPRLLPSSEPPPTHAAIVPPAALPLVRAAGLAVLLALLTFGASLRLTPTGLPPQAYYEAVMWGGGHILQFASVAAMLATWVMLLAPVLGSAPWQRRTGALLAATLTTPLFFAPLLVLNGTTSLDYRVGFTRYMQFGIAPTVIVALVLCGRALLHARRRGELATDQGGRLLGFLASALLTVLGFVLGATIHGSNTVVPAHYHASIGGVTVALMAVAYPLLEALGLPALDGRLRRIAAWQPALLGIGQAIFAAGFALAGAHGMQRKSYANEQHIRTTAEYLGLGVMGAGGLVAVGGGLLFLFLIGVMGRRFLSASARARRTQPAANEVIHVGR